MSAAPPDDESPDYEAPDDPSTDGADGGGDPAVEISDDDRRRRRVARAEQRRIADRLVGDWRSTRGFSDGQRRALIGLLISFLICSAIGLWRNPTFVPDPLPADASRYGELVDHIDPNTADVATISALPNLGEKRAKDIVDYRERLRTGDRTRVVFHTVDDLMRVRGIGYALSRQMEPFLAFPTTGPTR